MAQWMRRHARSIIFLITILALGGMFAGTQLPVALFPHVSFPRVRVTLDAGERPAERMVAEVTTPVEEALRAIPGVRGVRSTTSRGSAEISVNFEWGHDMVAAMLEVSAEVTKALASLPAETTFEVERMDPTVFPVIAYSITSDTHSLVELRDMALYQLRPVLSAVNGVAQIEVQGGDTEEYRVTIDPDKIAALGMSPDDVAAAVSASNVIEAVGRLQDHDKLYLVVSDTRFAALDELRKVVLRAGPDGVVTLGNVSHIEDTVAPQYTRVTADGHDAVLFQVYQQPDGNTVQIAGDISRSLEEQRHTLPRLKNGSIHIAKWYDQSELIIASEHSARDAILIGVVLAAVVLFVFLRNYKTTLIAILAVPAVLAVTVLLLYTLNMSFNIMTLGGMAAAVGLIIDDNIVMVEHITRRLHQPHPLRGGNSGHDEGASPVHLLGQSVTAAASEFTRPLLGSSLSTVIIFLPLAFLTGVTGAFFRALSLTMACGLAISFFIAWLAVPIVAAHWLGERDAESPPTGRVSHIARRSYHVMMHRLFRWPWLVVLILAGLVLLGYVSFQRVPSGFLPAMDEGGFILDYIAPPGTSLDETDRILRQVEQIISQNPNVATYSRRTGLQLGGGLTEPNTGDFFIRLKPFPRPHIEDVMDDIRQKVQHIAPTLDIETLQLMEDLIGDLTAVPQPIEIKLYSDDQQTLETIAPKVADAIGKIPGVIEVLDGIVPAGDALDVRVDRIKAALEGIDPDTVTQMLDTALSGRVATQVLQSPKLIDVRVWIPQELRSTETNLRHLLLHASNGRLIPLERIATVDAVTGQPEIDRDNLKRMVAVTGRISGRDMGSTLADVKHTLKRPDLLPPGMHYELGGLYQQQQIAFQGQLKVMVAAVLLVFVLLLFLYESFRVAVAMMCTTLAAMCCVVIGLWITGTELNITSLMGLTMVVGIVTEVAIFYVSEWTHLPANHEHHPRLIIAGSNRTRAIAMTTLAAILALLPLALGLGQGAAMLQPLAIAIIAGLMAQLPLVLTVLPALLLMLAATSANHE